MNSTPYYADESVTLWHGRCEDVLPSLTIDGPTHLLTDPPYFKVTDADWDNQWDKSSEFLDWMGSWLDMAAPLLSADASVWVFASPELTSAVESVVAQRFRVLNSVRWIKEQGWHQKSDLTAARSFLSPWEGIIFAEQPSDEYASLDYESRKSVFVAVGRHLSDARIAAGLTRSAVAPHLLGLYRNLDTAKAMLSDWEIGKSYISQEAHAIMQGLYGDRLRRHVSLLREYEDLRREYEDLRRPFIVKKRDLSTDLFNFGTVPPHPGKHPCEKPLGLLAHMIETSTRPNDTVLDCFAGSGAVLDAARSLGRSAVGIEMDEGWCEQIALRLSQDVLDFGGVA